MLRTKLIDNFKSKVSTVTMLLMMMLLANGFIECLNFKENQHEYEQMLLDKLFSSYNNRLRPSGTVQIKLALNLIQIIDIVEKDQIMIINAFVDHKWFDKRLSWEPKDYGNITLIRINNNQIWTPDTFIYSSADNNALLVPVSGVNTLVSYDGEIFWPNPLNHLRFRCSMDILWFPFDEQLCVIVFGSWSYSLHYLNYTYKAEIPSLDAYSENNVWQLVSYKSVRNEVKYETWIENDSFSEVIFKILVRRKPLFVLQNCVIPAAMLCMLTLTSFFIPFAPEMQIGVSIMLAFSVFKLRLSDDVPVQSDIIPLINVYFTLCMSFSLSAMIWFSLKNILVEKKKVPTWIRIIVLDYVWHLMLLNMWKHVILKSNSPHEIKDSNTNTNKRSSNSSKGSKQSANKKKLMSDSTTFNENPKTIIQQLEHSPIKILINRQSSIGKESTSKSQSARPDIFKMTKSDSCLSRANDEHRNEVIPIIIEKEETTNMLECPGIDDEEEEESVTAYVGQSKFEKSKNVTDMEVIQILNIFIFILFLIFIICLNLLCLYILPYHFKKPLSIDM